MSKSKLLFTMGIILSLIFIFFVVKINILNIKNIKIIKDMRGKYVKIYGLDKIVSLDDDSSEIIAALGLCEKIIGKLDDSFPPCLEIVPKIENNISRKLISLNPDLVIVPEDFEELETLERHNLPVFVVTSSRTLQDIYAKIHLLGQLLDKEQKARELISYLKNIESEVVSRIEEKGVYAVVLPTVNVTDTDVYVFVREIEVDILRKIGCKVPEEIDIGKITKINTNYLVKLNITVLIAKDISVNLKLPGIKVVRVPNSLEPKGLRSLLYMLWLAKELYPNLFSDINFEECMKRSLLRIYGINL